MNRTKHHIQIHQINNSTIQQFNNSPPVTFSSHPHYQIKIFRKTTSIILLILSLSSCTDDTDIITKEAFAEKQKTQTKEMINDHFIKEDARLFHIDSIAGRDGVEIVEVLIF